MARPKANKKAAKSSKPAKARGSAVKKAVAAVKKAVGSRKSASKPASKSAAATRVAKAAPKKAAAKKAVAKKASRKAVSAPAKKTAARKPAAKPQVKAATKPKVAAVKRAVAKKALKAPAKRGKVGRTLVRTQAVAASPAPRAVRASGGKGRSQASKPLQPGKIPTEAQLRRAPDSQYMNDTQLAFFQQRLMQMRGEVLAREVDVKERLHQREIFADPADRASAEEEHWLDLRLRERESLLLKKIDDALRRIRDKEYGYCEKTGEPIGIARLLARPTATVCVDVKGQNERAESQYRDR